jgi:hypothetical protein
VGEIRFAANRATATEPVLGHDSAAVKPASAGFGLLLLNAALAVVLQLAAPAQPVRSDRLEYEYAGKHGLEPGCPHDVYCYRVLVPLLLEQVPLDPDVRWRVYAATAKALAAFVVAVVVGSLTTVSHAPLLASFITQTTFGFTLTAYDPYTADPLVFLAAALLLLAWMREWLWLAIAVSVVGVFAKETVVLLSGSVALTALWHRRAQRGWQLWVGQAALSAVTLFTFHWVMDTYFDWGMARNQASKFWEGSWLAVWYSNMDSYWRIAFLLFIPFGLIWLFITPGYRVAPARLRALAAGALLPMLALNYVQNPERALGNAFFVAVPLATLFLARLPIGVAWAVAVSNGLVTAKAGLSTDWLPSTTLLVIPAAASAAWALWMGRSAFAERRVQQPTPGS